MPFIAAASRIYVASRRGGAVAPFEASGVAWTRAVAPPDSAYPKGQGGGARMPLGALHPTRTSRPVITCVAAQTAGPWPLDQGTKASDLAHGLIGSSLSPSTTRAAPRSRIELLDADERLTDSLPDAIAGFPVLSRATRNGLAYRRQFDAQLLDKCRHFRIRQQLKVGDPVFLRPAIGHGFGPGHCRNLRSRHRWMNY